MFCFFYFILFILLLFYFILFTFFFLFCCWIFFDWIPNTHKHTHTHTKNTHTHTKKIGENVKELFQYFGDWYFLGDDSKIKNFTKSGSTIKKANK